MRISFDTFSLELRCWQSKKDLRLYLAKFDDSLLLGEPRESERGYYSITLVPEVLPADKPWAIGLLTEGHGISPQIAPSVPVGLLLIGFDCEVVAIQIHSRKVLFTSKLTFLFRSLLRVQDSGWLVLHECGAQAISTTGETLWEFSRDVVESAEIQGNTLHFQFMDSEPVSINQFTGAEV